MSSSDSKIVDEIPTAMQRLAHLIVRCFYGAEHSVLIDLLIRNVCMREDDLRELLRFDAKQLRAVLISLKSSKLIKERQLVEHRADGRPIRHNYYFINYRAIMSIIKYKFDHMRRKLESEEKTSTHRSTYKCTKCLKPYSDLDINLLWDGEEMHCTYCRGIVEEDASSLPGQNARSSLARFNEQIWPLYVLMQELEGIQLALHLLEPTPCVIDYQRQKSDKINAERGAARGESNAPHRSKTDVDLYKSSFTVNIEGVDGKSTTDSSHNGQKQVPIWMQTSTVSGSPDHHRDLTEKRSYSEANIALKSEETSLGHHDIAQTLLFHESASKRVKVELSDVKSEFSDVAAETSTDFQRTKDEDFVEDEDEFEEVEDDAESASFELSVKGENYSLAEVMQNPDLIDQMTADEKENYVKISQAAYEKMYGD